MGQSGGRDVTKIFANRRAAIIGSTVWFFGFYILMANLYQGSIFSFLTVPELPKVPVTMAELLSSQLLVLTVTNLQSDTVSTTGITITFASVLKSIIIPELKTVMAGNLGYQRSLDAFETRLIFIEPRQVRSAEIISNISNSNRLKEFETSGTFAMMDSINNLKFLTEPITFLGKRFVIHGRGETGFQMISVMHGLRNFIFPRFNSVYRRFVEAGLIGTWLRAYRKSRLLFRMRTHGKEVYDKYSAQVNSGVPHQPEFHECTPGSLEALKYMFAICGMLLVGAGLIFLAEWKLVWGGG